MSAEKKVYVFNLISKIAGTRKIIDEHTLLYHDLNIAGDDAFEILEKIQEKFGTNFKSMEFKKYFPEEGDIFFLNILRKFGKLAKKDKLSIGHLLKVVESGSWTPPS